MAKPKAQKESDLQELTSKIRNSKSAVFSEYRGTSVKNLDKFRKTLSKEKVFSKVYKITLLKRALAAAGIHSDTIDYKVPVIISVSEDDETAPARLIKAISIDLKSIAILQGVVGGKLISKAEVMALADLPSKDQLRAQVVATINAPISGFVNVLAGNLRGLINVLNAISQKA